MGQNASIQSIKIGDRNNFTDCNNVKIGDGNTNCNNIYYNSDQDAQIMRWLSPLELKNRHQGVRTDRLDSVGRWLWETREWREWRSGHGGADGAVLFCSGSPGVGKTYLR